MLSFCGERGYLDLAHFIFRYNSVLFLCSRTNSTSFSLLPDARARVFVEMRSRVGTKIGWDAAKGLTISNFHQLCLRILRDNYQAVGFSHQVGACVHV